MTTRRWLRPRSRRVLVLAVTAVASLSPIAACAPAPAAPPAASPVPRAAAPRLYADPVNSLFAAAAHLVFSYNRDVVFGATSYHAGTATGTGI